MSPNWQRWKGIMKAYPFEEKRLAKWEPPYIVQPKYDGVRCRAVPLDNGDFLLLSSEENTIFSVPHINKVLNDNYPPWELDGELYCHGMRFEEIISITSRSVNLHPNYSEINFHIFDIVRESQSQAARLSQLNTLKIHRGISIAPYWLCESLDDVMRAYDQILEDGYEGIIVRHFFAPYVRKRSIYVMKFKPKKEDNYEIAGWQEEISIEGVPKGRLGALICRSGDGQLFNVGTGFDDGLRSTLWAIKEDLKGKVAKVQYQHLTAGKKVPRFPVFVEVIENERSDTSKI